MSMKEVFDHEIGPAPATRIDLDQVIRRQRRSTRLRAAGATLAVLALAGGAGLGVTSQLGGDQPVTPPLPAGQDQLAGFPEYAEGTRVLATSSGLLADRTLTLTFTPEHLDLVLLTRCDDHELDPGYRLAGELAAGEAAGAGTFCPGPELLQPNNWQSWAEFWADTGVEVGEPVTVTVALTSARHQVDGAAPEREVPAEGTFALAVAERVPFEDYPLPARPAQLAPLPEPVGVGLLLRADPASPQHPVATTIAWDATLAGCDAESRTYPLELVSQTPGTLRVLVEGVEVAHESWWDYQQATMVAELAEVCPLVADGEPVTITVEPEHVTGDWQVRVNSGG